MTVRFLLCIAFSALFLNVRTEARETGHRIEIRIDGYNGEEVYLGYRRAEKIYSRDTVALEEGAYVFEGPEPLAPGMYLVLMPPDNKYFEFIVTGEEQHFTVSTRAPGFFKNLQFRNSEENRLLYEYQTFMGEQVSLSKSIQEQIDAESGEKKKEKLRRQLKDVNEGVMAYQQKILQGHTGTFVARLIAAFREPEIPDPPVLADGSVDSTFRFRYFRDHYWDGYDFSYEVFLNTPYLHQKMDPYLERFTLQVPDSVISAVDTILSRAKANREVFKYCLSYLLNKYYRPEIMGMDAVYVHISDTYYRTGMADWVTGENLKKITDEAYMMRGVLIGNQAPNVRVQQYDPGKMAFTDELISPYDVDAEYLLIFLWKPGCGYCKKMSDELKPFYGEWKQKGLEIFSISSANHADLDKAIEDIKEKEMPWIVTADPYLRARAMQHYYGTSLPKLYLLDKHKKIIASRFGVPQIADIIRDFEKKGGAD